MHLCRLTGKCLGRTQVTHRGEDDVDDRDGSHRAGGGRDLTQQENHHSRAGVLAYFLREVNTTCVFRFA